MSQPCVYYGDHSYATLDRTAPSQVHIGTQSVALPIPQGWEVAPDDHEIVQNVIAKHPWGTHVIVVAGGAGYHTDAYDPAGQKHRENCLSYEKDGLLRPSSQNYRILLRTRSADSQYCFNLNRTLWSHKCFADCQVSCGDEVISCHRAILATASPVFERMLGSPMAEGNERIIQIKDHEPSTVSALLEFAYTGQIPNVSDATALLCLADSYEMDSLVAICAEKALGTLDASNVACLIRTLRNGSEKPATKEYWNRLLQKLKESPDLLAAALHSLQ